MNKSIKKILVTSASLLMLASAGISNINANASSGYYYLKRNYYSFKKGLRLHSPQADTEDSAEEFFNYGNHGDGVFIPWRDVGYHRNVHHAHHYYYRPVKRHRTRKPRRAKAHRARRHAKRHARRHGRRSHRRY